MDEKVSVIIPVYNAISYIDRCIESILNQTYDQIEIIVIDDGSNDGSGEKLDRIAKINGIIHVIHQENSGVSIARNRGINKAIGKYIMFVDVDDIVPENAVNSLVENSKYDLVCGSYLQNSNNKKKVIYEKKIYNGNNMINILSYVANAPWGKLYKREVIMKNNIVFPEKIPYGEDSIFLIRYITYAKNLIVIDKVVYDYSVGNLNSAMNKYYEDLYKYLYAALDEKKKYYKEKNIEFEDSNDRNTYFNMCLSHYIKHGCYDGIVKASEKFKINKNVKLSILRWILTHLREYVGFKVKCIKRKKQK